MPNGTNERDTRMAEQPNFDTMSRAELIELRAQLDKAISAAGERDRQRALKAAEELAREHGFSLAELVPGGGAKGRAAGGKRGGGSKAAATSPAPSDARYRNPENPDQTWSGRGRRPQWVHEATANGQELADLEIQ